MSFSKRHIRGLLDGLPTIQRKEADRSLSFILINFSYKFKNGKWSNIKIENGNWAFLPLFPHLSCF